MGELEALIADWPHKHAEPVARLVRIVRAKGEGYWEATGRARFERELAEDGLGPEQIAQALAVADEDFSAVDLDHVLGRLVARGKADTPQQDG